MSGRWRAREWLWVAALLTLLGLGLPVGSWEVEGSTTSGWYVPGSCVSVYDYDGYATLDCTGGTYNPGLYLPGSEGWLTAAQSGIRVFIAATLALTFLALRRRSPLAGTAAVAIGALGIVRYAVPPHPGIVVFALALLALYLALNDLQLLRPNLARWCVYPLNVKTPVDERTRRPGL